MHLTGHDKPHHPYEARPTDPDSPVLPSVSMRWQLTTLGLVAAIVAVMTSAAGAAPSAFHLTVEGRIGQALGGALLHEGTFRASPSFCSSGTGVDLWASPARPMVSYRLLSCDDRSGSLTVRLVDTEAEHTTGRTGIWRVVEGTGPYTELRGMGTLTGIPLSSDTGQPGTLRFRAEWNGIVDFDVIAPPIVVLRSSAWKRPGAVGDYVVSVAFTAADDVDGNRVSYKVSAFRSGRLLASKQGDLVTGATAVSLRIRPPGRPRTIRLEIQAWDPVGNARVVARSQELPR